MTLSSRLWRTLRQFVRFGLVGGSGVVVNLAVAVVMHKAHGGTQHGNDPVWAIPGTAFNVRFRHVVWIVAFLVANLWNFQLNRSWTFKSAKHSRWWKEFWPFLAVGSVAAGAGLFILTAFTHTGSPIYLPDPFFNETKGIHSREYWAQLLTIVVTMPINFLVNKVWTFRAVRGHHAELATVPLTDAEQARAEQTNVTETTGS
ncbi:GtrA family protein [Aestuariimicrobium soli]|uniref:GtrA family protein n=1 Tax=Aestuariimicrobium soli TaxID=2035834 RepID=UPI003EB998F4